MKKIISLLLIFTLFISLLPNSTVKAESYTKEEIQLVLDDFFLKLHETLLKDSTNDYTSEEFRSINGYIIAKSFVSTRESYIKLLNGICSVETKEILIEDLMETSSGLEAMVYVTYDYAYDDGTPENQSSVGGLYRVNLEFVDNHYKVIDLDTTDIEIQAIKDTLVVAKTRNLENNFHAVDDYFSQAAKNTDSMLELEESDFLEPEEELPEKTPRGSVSFNVDKARNWGYKLGLHEQNYIFKRAPLDCTNFISQCVWAGYGGANGYNIPTDPSYSDATCVALRKRVASDYRMTSSWYGRNYNSTAYSPPVNFCSVEEFYTYVTTNTGNGPKATAYNNNKVYSSMPTNYQKADVLQVYRKESKRYYHTVIVTTPTTYSPANYAKVKVAQHEDEKKNRPLADLINKFGGSTCKLRLLRFKSTTY